MSGIFFTCPEAQREKVKVCLTCRDCRVSVGKRNKTWCGLVYTPKRDFVFQKEKQIFARRISWLMFWKELVISFQKVPLV